MLFGYKNSSEVWRNMPGKTLLIFLAAVFFTFTTLGFVGDISSMGREPFVRHLAEIALTGLFPVAYAYIGITLHGRRFWIPFLPLLIVHFTLMGLLARWFPEQPRTAQLNAAQTSRLQSLVSLDSAAAMICLSLGYAGFVIAFVREGRRHIRVHTEKALLESEMQAAGEIQQLILPEHNQTFPGFRVDSVYTPAQQVGGDFFQILPDNSGGILLVIGDVAGKGLPAAMLVSMLVGAIRTAAEETTDPATILRKLNDSLTGHTRGGFSTALAARIAKNGNVEIANAGHLSPYLDGKEIALPGALPLGIAGGGQYELTNLTLNPGSRLTFHTDGVVEAQNPQKELFGFDRTQAISGQSAAEIAQTAVQFGQSDDITVVTIERV